MPTEEEKDRHERFEDMVALLLSTSSGRSVARVLAYTGRIPLRAIARDSFEILEQAEQFVDWYSFPYREAATGERSVPDWVDLSWFPEYYDDAV